jgi:hypothetical protein
MASSLPAPYLPDEVLLEILSFIPRDREHQSLIATFCRVQRYVHSLPYMLARQTSEGQGICRENKSLNWTFTNSNTRQWYDVGISYLYEAPFLTGHAYTLFVRTVCPSVIPHVKRSELAGHVKELDLSLIVHQGSKSTTARLLGRTKNNLRLFIAPQASFAINCWASLSKCTRLKVLDLSLISEAISYQSLNQTLKQLSELQRLYMPRCSTRYDTDVVLSKRVIWPPRLQHVSLSGSVRGKFLWEMLQQPNTFPPTLRSMSMLHCPGLEASEIKPLLNNLAATLTTVELRDLPAVKQGRFNNILNWLPRLEKLIIATDYIDRNFGHQPEDWSSARWEEAKPLQALTLVTSGTHNGDPDRDLTIGDLFDLIDTRFLGRLRWLVVAKSTGWDSADDGAELGALRNLLVNELDKENWELRRWHYEDLSVPQGMQYEEWAATTIKGEKERASLMVLDDRGSERERRWPELR